MFLYLLDLHYCTLGALLCYVFVPIGYTPLRSMFYFMFLYLLDLHYSTLGVLLCYVFVPVGSSLLYAWCITLLCFCTCWIFTTLRSVFYFVMFLYLLDLHYSTLGVLLYVFVPVGSILLFALCFTLLCLCTCWIYSTLRSVLYFVMLMYLLDLFYSTLCVLLCYVDVPVGSILLYALCITLLRLCTCWIYSTLRSVFYLVRLFLTK